MSLEIPLRDELRNIPWASVDDDNEKAGVNRVRLGSDWYILQHPMSTRALRDTDSIVRLSNDRWLNVEHVTASDADPLPHTSGIIRIQDDGSVLRVDDAESASQQSVDTGIYNLPICIGFGLAGAAPLLKISGDRRLLARDNSRQVTQVCRDIVDAVETSSANEIAMQALGTVKGIAMMDQLMNVDEVENIQSMFAVVTRTLLVNNFRNLPAIIADSCANAIGFGARRLMATGIDIDLGQYTNARRDYIVSMLSNKSMLGLVRDELLDIGLVSENELPRISARLGLHEMGPVRLLRHRPKSGSNNDEFQLLGDGEYTAGNVRLWSRSGYSLGTDLDSMTASYGLAVNIVGDMSVMRSNEIAAQGVMRIENSMSAIRGAVGVATDIEQAFAVVKLRIAEANLMLLPERIHNTMKLLLEHGIAAIEYMGEYVDIAKYLLPNNGQESVSYPEYIRDALLNDEWDRMSLAKLYGDLIPELEQAGHDVQPLRRYRGQ